MHRRRLIPAIPVIGIISMILPLSGADRPPAGIKAGAAEASPSASQARFQAGNRRDPFLNPLLLVRKSQELLDQEESRGQAPPGISGMYIDQVKLVGVSLSEGGATAVWRGPDKRVYFLQPRDRFFDGYLKQIKEDSVVVVRETRMKSGKVLTEEVTKQLRTP